MGETKPWHWRVMVHWDRGEPTMITVRDYYAAHDLVEALFGAEGLRSIEVEGDSDG